MSDRRTPSDTLRIGQRSPARDLQMAFLGDLSEGDEVALGELPHVAAGLL
ncbi:hypothetical protein AB0K12_39760 [Nonomuraea sp. NPDC049419]